MNPGFVALFQWENITVTSEKHLKAFSIDNQSPIVTASCSRGCILLGSLDEPDRAADPRGDKKMMDLSRFALHLAAHAQELGTLHVHAFQEGQWTMWESKYIWVHLTT